MKRLHAHHQPHKHDNHDRAASCRWWLRKPNSDRRTYPAPEPLIWTERANGFRAEHRGQLVWVGYVVGTVERGEADRQTSQATQRSDPMNLKQGQEVRDAADPNRIGIVVNIVLGDARVFWQDTERATWMSERPVVATPIAAWTEYAAWPDGFITDIDDTGRATLDASENRDKIVRVWAFEPPKSYAHACELAKIAG